MILVFDGKDEVKLSGYSDANFKADRDNSYFQVGQVILLNNETVTLKSSKQQTVVDSTYESEYITASEAMKEVT